MKKILGTLLALSLSFSLAACSESAGKQELEDNDKDKATAKVGDDSSKSEKSSSDKKKKEEIWTYYNDAKTSVTWEGLKFDIQKVAVSDKAPTMDDDGKDITGSAVAVKFKIENTTSDKTYNTYPDQATLVTSTGEQIEDVDFESDSIGGEINEGVIKEGQIIWFLKRGHAEDVKWVKIKWDSDYTDPSGNYDLDKYQTHEVKLDLKQ
ncbi:hypothetical protein CN918_30100 [Priestia megaterium]|nr:hypothetical protein CN918_30100 [Priestia megaterium]